MTKDDFDKLLRWLDEDREIAAQKYSLTHRRLMKFFLSKKISLANELADETIDRVIKKIDFLIENFTGKQESYFFSIAKKVFLEYLKTPKDVKLDSKLVKQEQEEDEFEERYECLRACLQKLPEENRRLVVSYFQKNKQSKIDHHKKIIENLGVSPEVLRTKVFRLKKVLKSCIKSCLRKKSV